MPADRNLEALMAQYQLGDLDSAAALIDRLSPRLHRFFVAWSGSRADADDLLQETWLRIHKVRHTWRPGEQVLPWLFAIARRVRVDHYRRSIRTTAREQELENISSIPAPPSPESNPMDGLLALLAPLSQAEREVIEMLKVEGMSLLEVARATSSTVGSVKQKVHRAYTKIRGAVSVHQLRKRQSGGPS
jgi:RNA polymerase sigma-70 factor (ECF subfamily)